MNICVCVSYSIEKKKKKYPKKMKSFFVVKIEEISK